MERDSNLVCARAIEVGPIPSVVFSLSPIIISKYRVCVVGLYSLFLLSDIVVAITSFTIYRIYRINNLTSFRHQDHQEKRTDTIQQAYNKTHRDCLLT